MLIAETTNGQIECPKCNSLIFFASRVNFSAAQMNIVVG